MNYDELQRVWAEQPTPPPPAGSAAETVWQTVRDKSRAFSRTILWRDLREVAACGLVMFIFGGIAAEATAEGAPAWPAQLAVALTFGVAAFLLIDRWLARRRFVPRGEAVLVEIERAADAVRHQVWLLRNVHWWYLLPLGGSAMCVALQYLLYGAPEMPLVVRAIPAVVMLGVTVAVNVWIWRLNQRAVKRELEPQLADLEDQRRAWIAES